MPDDGRPISSVALHELNAEAIGPHYVEFELAKGKFNLDRNLRVEDLKAEFDTGECRWFVYVRLAGGSGGVRMELKCTRRVAERPGLYLDGMRQDPINWKISLGI